VDEGNGRLTDWHLPRVGIQEGAYSEWDAKRFVRQIIQALQFLHEQSIVHRWESELVHVHNVLGKRRLALLYWRDAETSSQRICC
jgi:hypothetical protein